MSDVLEKFILKAIEDSDDVEGISCGEIAELWNNAGVGTITAGVVYNILRERDIRREAAREERDRYQLCQNLN